MLQKGLLLLQPYQHQTEAMRTVTVNGLAKQNLPSLSTPTLFFSEMLRNQPESMTQRSTSRRLTGIPVFSCCARENCCALEITRGSTDFICAALVDFHDDDNSATIAWIYMRIK
jgi:hypothetical protein